MSWNFNTQPGKEEGFCPTACTHPGCVWQRATAARPCLLCRRPIEYGVRFYESGGDVAHAACVDRQLAVLLGGAHEPH